MGQLDFQILQDIGKGSFGTVHKVKRKIDGQIYALKRVKVSNLKNKDIQNALNQVRLLASMNHPNIVAYKQSYIDSKNQFLNIVMQFADKGDVQSKLRYYKNKKRRYTQGEIWKALSHITSGLSYLHANKIIHRDLKSANIFVFQHQQQGNFYKIGDMNVSKLLKNQMAQTQTGTPYYCSPEVWKDQPYDYKSDIYSLGCLIFQMASQCPPFQAKNLQQLFKKVMKSQIPQIPKNYSSDVYSLIKRCMNINPKLRPSAVQIFQLADKKLSSSVQMTEKPRAKSIGVVGHYQMLKTINPKLIKNLKGVLPAPKYQRTPEPFRAGQQNKRKVKLCQDINLKLPRLSTDKQSSFYTKCRTEKSSKSRPLSDRHSAQPSQPDQKFLLNR